jgi:hypothetical protein
MAGCDAGGDVAAAYSPARVPSRDRLLVHRRTRVRATGLPNARLSLSVIATGLFVGISTDSGADLRMTALLA